MAGGSHLRSMNTQPFLSSSTLGLRRQFLHAARLAFTHPITGEPVQCASTLPADLAAALERARG